MGNREEGFDQFRTKKLLTYGMLIAERLMVTTSYRSHGSTHWKTFANNYVVAKKRLDNLVKRLEREELYDRYDTEMSKLLQIRLCGNSA